MTSALSSLGFSSTPLNDLFHVRGSGEIAVSDLKCRQLSAGSFAPQCGKRDTKFFRRVPERQRDKSFATLTHNSTQPYGCIPFPPYFKAQLSYAPVSTGIGWVSRNNYTGRLCLVLHITGLRSECFGPADSWSDISPRSEKGQSHDQVALLVGWCYRPRNVGRRFSTKAATPSPASWVGTIRANAASSIAKPSSIDASMPR